MQSFLDFEKQVAEMESRLEDLRRLAAAGDAAAAQDALRQEASIDQVLHQIYGRLTAAQKVQVARHPDRPHTQDYIAGLLTDFTPLAGDRMFAEDPALIGGLGRLNGKALVVLGNEKGHDTDARVRHNFGMAKPEGYRKAQRLMGLAERFRLPVLTFIDTAGAWPGVDAEKRGQAEAIARAIEVTLRLTVPVIAVIIGEGGSGGAIAIATANRILMLEHAICSVISPEGCASILWRDPAMAQEAAAALRLTAQDLRQLGVVDEIIAEPSGGAHRNVAAAVAAVGDAVSAALADLETLEGPALRQHRRQKFLDMGTVLIP